MILRRPFIVFDSDAVDAATPAEVQPAEGQGHTSADTAAVQPEEGQGQQGSSLYEEALSSVPEEHRQYVEDHFKEWDRRVSEKFNESAQFRKEWEAYADTGIKDYDPEQVKALVDIASALQDPDSARQLFTELLEQLDTDDDPDAGIEPADDTAHPDLGLTADEVTAWRQERQDAARRAAEEAALNDLQEQYETVRKLHGRDFSEKEEQRLANLAEKYAKAGAEKPLEEAYAFLSDLIGDAEADLVKGKAKEPSAAEGDGRASTAPTPVEDFAEAERLLRERMSAVVF